MYYIHWRRWVPLPIFTDIPKFRFHIDVRISHQSLLVWVHPPLQQPYKIFHCFAIVALYLRTNPKHPIWSYSRGPSQFSFLPIHFWGLRHLAYHHIPCRIIDHAVLDWSLKLQPYEICFLIENSLLISSQPQPSKIVGNNRHQRPALSPKSSPPHGCYKLR